MPADLLSGSAHQRGDGPSQLAHLALQLLLRALDALEHEHELVHAHPAVDRGE